MLFRKLRNGGEIEIHQKQVGDKMAKRSLKTGGQGKKTANGVGKDRV